MTRSDIAARLILIEEALDRIEAALPGPGALGLIAQRLSAIELTLSLVVSPSDVRASAIEASAHMTAQADAAPLQSAQLAEMMRWIESNMSGERMEWRFDDLMFVTKQFVSLWQASRDEQVLMRADIRRLAALCEQALKDDDAHWRVGDAERRKASGF